MLLMDFIATLTDFVFTLMDCVVLLIDFVVFPVRNVLSSVGKWSISIAHCPPFGRKMATSTGEIALVVVWHGRCVRARMAHYKISMKFAKLPDGELGSFAGNTIVEMTDNPGFLDPRVSLDDMLNAKDTFVANMLAAMDGGRLATATKNASRLALIMLLRQQAAYVQSIAGTDLALLLSSGFLAANTNRARMLLPQAMIKSVKSIQSTMFSLALEPVRTARGYEVRYKMPDGEYVFALVSSSSRGILLKNLVPGVVYTIQVRAIGGLTGCGDWSNPVSRMAT